MSWQRKVTDKKRRRKHKGGGGSPTPVHPLRCQGRRAKTAILACLDIIPTSKMSIPGKVFAFPLTDSTLGGLDKENFIC